MLSWKSRSGPGAALIVGFSVLSLAGCGPQEESDSTPPDPIIKLEKSQGKYRYGVTDTIVVDFSEAIDTAGLAVAISPSQGLDHRFKSRTRLVIYGTGKASGASHFNINSPFSLTLAGLRDLEGNGRGEISEAFQPYPWVDRDFVDTSFTGYDSLYTANSTWIDGSAFTDTLVTEGRLDFSSNFGREDRQDYKIIRMDPPDSLKLTLTCSKALNIRMQIAGPLPEADLAATLARLSFADSSFFSDSTRTRGSLSTRFQASFDSHFDKLGSASAPGVYAIRLSIPADTEGFYRLGLRMVKRKN
ncbi:MAG TPA: hypothetical protein VJ385_06950 [Fibrobacteria bacterium]|nr:hypothetical protein [Fibrobacteria bacterium]